MLKKFGKYIENWKNYLNQNDLAGMKKEYTKIKNKKEEIIPLEDTLKEIKTIENIQTLIKNKGNSLENITTDEIRLAQTI